MSRRLQEASKRPRGGRGNNPSRQRRDHCPATSDIPPEIGSISRYPRNGGGARERRQLPSSNALAQKSRAINKLTIAPSSRSTPAASTTLTARRAFVWCRRRSQPQRSGPSDLALGVNSRLEHSRTAVRSADQGASRYRHRFARLGRALGASRYRHARSARSHHLHDWNLLIHSSTTPPSPACPSCGAVDPVFNANTAPEVTYMRCKKCGEVWNAGRCVQPRKVSSPVGGGRSASRPSRGRCHAGALSARTEHGRLAVTNSPLAARAHVIGPPGLTSRGCTCGVNRSASGTAMW